MNDVRQEFLTRTGFAGNKNGTVGRRHLVDRLQDFAHLRGVPQKAVQHLGFHELVVRAVLQLRLDFAGGRFQQGKSDWLFQETVRPARNRRGSTLPVAVVAKHKYLDSRVFFLQETHHVHVVLHQERNLDKRKVYRIFLDEGHEPGFVTAYQQIGPWHRPGTLHALDKLLIQIRDQDIHRLL